MAGGDLGAAVVQAGNRGVQGMGSTPIAGPAGSLPQRPQGPQLQNSGLSRFGASFNPYMPQTYTPKAYQPQPLAPSRGLGTSLNPGNSPGLGTSLAGGAMNQGGGAGTGPDGGQGGGIGSSVGPGIGIGGFANPDNSIAPGQTNTTGLTSAMGNTALAAMTLSPVAIANALNAISNISTTVGSVPDAATMNAASVAAQADTNPDTNGSVGDSVGSDGSGADGNTGNAGEGVGNAGDNGDGPGGDSGGGGGGGGK